MDDDDHTAAGLRLRDTVLDADRRGGEPLPAAEFRAPMDDLINRYGWGDIWSRGVLDLKTRSLLTTMMLVALNRPVEFRIHLRGALNNGVSRTELQEALLHLAVYAGMPAANSGFRWAIEGLAEIDRGDVPDDHRPAGDPE